jgi:predicted lipase
MTDLNSSKTKWKSYPECSTLTNKCEVHEGFYESEQKVFPSVLAEVRRLKAQFPAYSVKTSGHSLGAALAYLTQLDLIK